jgi:hypothetical protein
VPTSIGYVRGPVVTTFGEMSYPPLMVYTEDMARFRHFAFERGLPDSAATFRALLDLAELETRGGMVSVEVVANWLSHIDRLDEIKGADTGLPQFNPLWDAAQALRVEFGDGK